MQEEIWKDIANQNAGTKAFTDLPSEGVDEMLREWRNMFYGCAKYFATPDDCARRWPWML